jgi:hypothetical protein
MPNIDAGRLLAMLRDPSVETREVATAAGVPREEAARAARLALGIARATPEEVATLPGALAAALARAAAAAGRGDVLAALTARPEKEVAKEAKRGLHLLRSRGVAVPEPARAAAPAAPPAPEPRLDAYASSIDGNGERAVWVPRNVPGKGIEVAQAVVSDTRGVLELHVGIVGRKEWRQIARGLVEHGAAMGVAEIDCDRARALVRSARALNDRSGQRLPDRAGAWLSQLGPEASPPDPARDFPPLPDEEERDALASSAKLHDLPMMKSWLADETFLRGVAAKLDEVAVSPLYIDEYQRAEQMDRIVADAVEAYFDVERRRLLSSRLFDVAAQLAAGGDPAHAAAAAAAARALAAGAPAASIPFARLLVEKAFPPQGPSPAPEPAGRGASPLIVPPR